jgi:pyrroline-5-carboxylate reductase
MKNRKVAFVGGGNMTRAIAGGLVDSGFAPADIFISEPVEEARRSLADDLPGVNLSANNNDIVAATGCLVLAVKPQILPEVCRDLEVNVQKERPLIVSIAAGIRGTDIDAWLGGGLSVVRIMPNQPALLQLGVSGLYANEETSDDERDYAAGIIGAVGAVVHVGSEADIDVITAISGSGPAYFFLLIDVLMKTAIDLGIAEDNARTLAIETARGAAALASSESENMDTLMARVRSPAGTTAAALQSLESANVRDIFSTAIKAARDRANLLADEASAR